MWAQLIRMPAKPGKDLTGLSQALRDAEQPGSGLIRTLSMRDQSDPPSCTHSSCSTARRRPARGSRTRVARSALQDVRAMMADILDGPPEFVDLVVEEEWTGR